MTGRLAIRHCIRDGRDVLSAPFLCQRMPLGRAGQGLLTVLPSFRTVYDVSLAFVWTCTRRMGVRPDAVGDVDPMKLVWRARRHEFNEVFFRHCAAHRNKDAQSHGGIE